MTDLFHPGTQRAIEAAARKGVTLDIRRPRASIADAGGIAAVVGVDLGQIVRSVLCVGQLKGALIPILCLVSGRNQIDLKQLAAICGSAELREATAQEVQDLLGYTTEELPPFGHGKGLRVVMDQELCANEWVWASSGTPDLVIRLEPRTLRSLANAVVGPVTQPSQRLGLSSVGASIDFGSRSEA